MTSADIFRSNMGTPLLGLNNCRAREFFKDEAMSNQPRVVKVLAALLISMTTGAIVLIALGNNPPSAGAFSLSVYSRLDPVEQSIRSRSAQSHDKWDCIEIYHSHTRGGNIEQLASIERLNRPEDMNCHFLICNGHGGDNGQIQSTERWQKQRSATPDRSWYGSKQTVRICLVADGKTARPTDFQRKRLEALVNTLSKKFSIVPERVYYPND